MNCSKEGCTQEARVGLSIKLWAVGHSRSAPHATLALQIAVCDEHKKTIGRVVDWLPPKSRTMITRAFLDAGRHRPDFNSAEWEFRQLQ